ncbi:uncharacterized protein METZ01_LOCUS22227, partial [marine metagenome]
VIFPFEAKAIKSLQIRFYRANYARVMPIFFLGRIKDNSLN